MCTSDKFSTVKYFPPFHLCEFGILCDSEISDILFGEKWTLA